MNSDRYAIIIKNACSDLNDTDWTPEAIANCIDPRTHEKCQVYDWQPSTNLTKQTGSSIEMKGDVINKYFCYLSTREQTGNKKGHGQKRFAKTRYYFSDIDMSIVAPDMKREFNEKFKVPEILPTGKYCLMRSVSY
jgi:hypothetical protein